MTDTDIYAALVLALTAVALRLLGRLHTARRRADAADARANAAQQQTATAEAHAARLLIHLKHHRARADRYLAELDALTEGTRPAELPGWMGGWAPTPTRSPTCPRSPTPTATPGGPDDVLRRLR